MQRIDGEIQTFVNRVSKSNVAGQLATIEKLLGVDAKPSMHDMDTFRSSLTSSMYKLLIDTV